jgi:hypothetical protein
VFYNCYLLNNAIRNEVDSWNKLYNEICNSAKAQCEISEELMTFRRYVVAEYNVKASDEEISVTFDVSWIEDVGNYSPSYTRIFTYDVKTNAVYETHTASKKIYV